MKLRCHGSYKFVGASSLQVAGTRPTRILQPSHLCILSAMRASTCMIKTAFAQAASSAAAAGRITSRIEASASIVCSKLTLRAMFAVWLLSTLTDAKGGFCCRHTTSGPGPTGARCSTATRRRFSRCRGCAFASKAAIKILHLQTQTPLRRARCERHVRQQNALLLVAK